jgi:hypothetical protein
VALCFVIRASGRRQYAIISERPTLLSGPPSLLLHGAHKIAYCFLGSPDGHLHVTKVAGDALGSTSGALSSALRLSGMPATSSAPSGTAIASAFSRTSISCWRTVVRALGHPRSTSASAQRSRRSSLPLFGESSCRKRKLVTRISEDDRVDQGSEFICRDLDLWAYAKGLSWTSVSSR